MINQAPRTCFSAKYCGASRARVVHANACLDNRGWRVASPPAVFWSPLQGLRAVARGAREGTKGQKGQSDGRDKGTRVLCKICVLAENCEAPPGSAVAKPLNSCKFVLFVVSFLRSFPTFLTFLRQNCQNENFSSHRFWGRFGAVFVSFARLCGFQITHCQSMSYLENRPLPSRLQRLPGQKMPARDPL